MLVILKNRDIALRALEEQELTERGMHEAR